MADVNRLWRSLGAVAVVLFGGGCDDASSPRGADGDVVTDTDVAPTTSTPDTTADTTHMSVADSAPADVVLGDPDVLVGSFQVRLNAPLGDTPGTTSILGKVFDGPTPSPVGYRVMVVAGADDSDCQLLVPVIPFCETACVGGDTCVADDVCQAYPNAKSVGTVTMTGLSAAVRMDPISGTYQPLGPSLPYPAFAAGDVIHLQTSGGDYTPFMISSVGIAPLDVTSSELVLNDGQPLALTWRAPEAARQGDAVIDVKLDVSHHGGTKGLIQCTTADDGNLTLSAALVGALLDLGIAGHPTVVMARTATGSAVIEPGRVELTVASEVETEVTIPGLRSCFGDEDCDSGETCQDDLTCK